MSDSQAPAAPRPPLYAVMPPDGEVTIDGLLDGFLRYCEQRGLSLYPAQEEAILEIVSGKNVILATPTGSGKSTTLAHRVSRLVREDGAEPSRILVCSFSRETVGAESVEMLVGTIEKGNGALPHAHPGIDQITLAGLIAYDRTTITESSAC